MIFNKNYNIKIEREKIKCCNCVKINVKIIFNKADNIEFYE